MANISFAQVPRTPANARTATKGPAPGDDALSRALSGLPSHCRESKICEKHAGLSFMKDFGVFTHHETPKDKREAARSRLLKARGRGARTYDRRDVSDDIAVIAELHKGLDPSEDAGVMESRRYLYHHARLFVNELKEMSKDVDGMRDRRERCGRCRYGLPCYQPGHETLPGDDAGDRMLEATAPLWAVNCS